MDDNRIEVRDGVVAESPDHTRYQPPTERVGARFVVPFALSYFGYFLAILTPTIAGLPVYLSTILPEDQRAGVLSLIMGLAGIVSLLAQPLIGRLSDRTTFRLGMRKPWLVAGTVTGVIGLVITGSSTEVPVVVAGYLLAVFGLNACGACLLAILPDQVPHAQRGKISGILGMAVPLGAIGGAFLVQALSATPLLMFLTPAIPLALGVLLFLPAFNDRKLSREDARLLPKYGIKEFFTSFWVNPLKHRDFGWAWISRFCVFMGIFTLITFQAFYLQYQLNVPLPEVAGVVALGMLAHYSMVLAASPLAGWISDRLDRRKIFVAISAVFYAVGLCFIAFADSLPMFFIGMVITGIGEGAYLAVDLALLVDVLPDPDNAAKDINVFGIASSLPATVSPAIAPILLAIPLGMSQGGNNYIALFTCSAVFAVLGALAIQRVRTVR